MSELIAIRHAGIRLCIQHKERELNDITRFGKRSAEMNSRGAHAVRDHSAVDDLASAMSTATSLEVEAT